MIIRSEEIYKKANSIVKSCGTRDTLKIARELGIHLHFLDNLNDLLGMYTYRHKERFVTFGKIAMKGIMPDLVTADHLHDQILHIGVQKNMPLFMSVGVHSLRGNIQKGEQHCQKLWNKRYLEDCP